MSIGFDDTDFDDIIIENNKFVGYPRVEIGIDRTSAIAADLERRWSWKNNQQNYLYVGRAAHGLVIGDDEFKPVDIDGNLHDGTPDGGDFAGILVDVIDANNYVLAGTGQQVTMPASKVTVVASYDPNTDGAYLAYANGPNGYGVDAVLPDLLETVAYTTDELIAKVSSRGGTDEQEAVTANQVDTVADLATLVATNGQIVHVLGYYTRADGGGQAVVFDSGSSATVNGGTVFDAPLTGGRFLAVDTDTVNIKCWGIRPGSGAYSANNTTQLQLIIDTLRADRGGTIFVPRGKYYHSMINLSNETMPIQFKGQGTTRANETDHVSELCFDEDSYAGSAWDMQNVDNMVFEDLAFTWDSTTFTGVMFGNGTLQTNAVTWNRCYIGTDDTSKSNADGIHHQKMINTVVNETRFQYCKNAMINTSGDFANSIHIRNCNFFPQRDGNIVNPGESWIVENCSFEPLQGGAPNAVYTDSNGQLAQGFVFSGNWCGDATTTTGYWCEMAVAGGTFIGNRFLNNIDAGVKLVTSKSGNVSTSCCFLGNNCRCRALVDQNLAGNRNGFIAGTTTGGNFEELMLNPQGDHDWVIWDQNVGRQHMVVETLDDMKAGKYWNQHGTVQTLGYHEVGDGAGNLYGYKRSTQPTQDGGFIVTNDSAGHHYALDQTTANVKQFGAKGDGVTDDRAAIQQALDNSLDVYIPEGTYVLSKSLSSWCLKYWDNQRIRGAGIGKTILKMADGVTDGYTRILSSNLVTTNVVVEGITFDGNRSNFAGSGTADDLHGIFTQPGSSNFTLRACEFKANQGDGCVLDGVDMLVEGSIFSDNYRYGINVPGASNVRILNNTVNDSDIGVCARIWVTDTDTVGRNIIIANNTIEAQTGILFDRNNAVKSWYENVIIAQNTIKTNDDASAGASGAFQTGGALNGIYLRGVHGAVVSENVLSNGTNAGFIHLISENRNIVISSNSLANQVQDLSALTIESAINIGRWSAGGQNRSISVANNTIDNCMIGIGVQTPTNERTGTFTTTHLGNLLHSTDHKLIEGDIVTLTTTGTLPTGLDLATEYYVINTSTDGNDFQLSNIVGDVEVDFSDDGTGTHTFTQKTVSEDIEIIGNTLTHVLAQKIAGSWGIQVRDAERTTIEGNKIRFADNSTGNIKAIYLQNTTTSPTDTLIANNLIQMRTGYAGYELDIDEATNVTVVGNTSTTSQGFTGTIPAGKFRASGNSPPIAEFLFADADTTPSVQGYGKWKTQNTGSTLITNFDDGDDGQVLTVLCDSNTSVQDNANIALAGGSNYVPISGGTITLQLDGTVWRELAVIHY
jgi:hypothetical protein